MGLVEHLLETRTPLELAKELARMAKDNAHLKDSCYAYEVEIFWLKATNTLDNREAFEKWLLDVHMLTSEWQPDRNCFKDFPAHLAWQAWQATHKFNQSKE